MSPFSKLIWQPVEDELKLWAHEKRRATLWLRDDDAVEPTSKLGQLDALCGQYDVPYTIATIPNFTTQALVEWCVSCRLCTVAVHGVAHTNHAPKGQKKCELGLQRGLEVISDELIAARQKTQDLFGAKFVDMLVPPWNRIDPMLVPKLNPVGFKTLSTYGWPKVEETSIFHLNTHVDIIDWKGTRGGLPVKGLIENLVAALQTARSFRLAQPIGILTHHLVHDDLAWQFLQELMSFCNQNENIVWQSAHELCAP